MASKILLGSIISILLNSWETYAYGKLMDPVNRGSAWRLGFNTPINYDDMMNNCGGFTVQHIKYDGKCGPCGDSYGDSQPRANENTGKYGKKEIVRNYMESEEIDMEVELTANLLGGSFAFFICDLSSSDNKPETETCFKPLELSDGTTTYQLNENTPTGSIKISAKLPVGLICSHCVIMWQYTAANNWGICEDGETGKLGCGPQETFRTCSDVSIE